MYKTKLQEFCHRKVWKLPEYSISKQGQDHNPSFEAVVTVNGNDFRSHTNCKSSKQAQNEAAKLAFESLSLSLSLPSPSPQQELPLFQPSFNSSSFPQPSFNPPLDNLGTRTDLDNKLSSPERPQVKLEESNESAKIEDSIEGSSSMSYNLDVNFSTATPSVQLKVQDANHQFLVVSDIDKECSKLTAMQHLYKNQLQSFAQKKKLTLPVYTSERDGPPHASRFKCKVEVDGRIYESPEYFATLKDAEHAAAKVALMSLCEDGAQEENPGLYKNLLQEMAQKRGLGLPSYSTLHHAEVHVPIFVSTVKVGGEAFKGQSLKTKKQAEMSAAKVAYFTLRERDPNLSKSPLVVSPGGQASQLASSSLQSAVSTDLELQVRSGSPVIPYPSMTMEKQPSDGGPESISTRKRGPSSCDHDFARDISISSHNVAQPGPTPDSRFILNVISKLEAGKSCSSKRIVVCPRQPNMKLPEDSSILPLSDDKWVAFSLSKGATESNMK